MVQSCPISVKGQLVLPTRTGIPATAARHRSFQRIESAKRAKAFRHLMPGNHGFRFQGLELVERGDPLKPALCVGLAEVGMNSVVDGVPANDQSNRRDVQAGGGSRIGPLAFTATSLCPSSSSSSSSSGSATNKRSGIWPRKSRRQKFSILSGDRCSCMALTTSGVATASNELSSKGNS